MRQFIAIVSHWINSRAESKLTHLKFEGTVFLKATAGLAPNDHFEGVFTCRGEDSVLLSKDNSKVIIPLDNVAYLEGNLYRA